MNEWKLTKALFQMLSYIKSLQTAQMRFETAHTHKLSHTFEHKENKQTFSRLQSRAYTFSPTISTPEHEAVLLKRSYTNLLHHTIFRSTLCIRIQLRRFIKCNGIIQSSFFSDSAILLLCQSLVSSDKQWRCGKNAI